VAEAHPAFGLSNEPLSVAPPPVVMEYPLGAHLLFGDVGNYCSVSVEILIVLGKETWIFHLLPPNGQSEPVVGILHRMGRPRQ